MATESWIFVALISGINISTLVGGLIHLTNKLTRIETDLKWIKQGCPMCGKKEE